MNPPPPPLKLMLVSKPKTIANKELMALSGYSFGIYMNNLKISGDVRERDMTLLFKASQIN